MRKALEIRLPAPMVAPLVDTLLPLAADEDCPLAIKPNLKAIEEDFREQWADDLRGILGGDLATFLRIFGGSFRADGVLQIALDDLEALLRATSALRLKLRAGPLKSVPDEALEAGEVEYGELTPTARRGFEAYEFLALLQEILIQVLDGKVPRELLEEDSRGEDGPEKPDPDGPPEPNS